MGEGHHRFIYEGCLLEATVSIHASETVKDIIKFEEYCLMHVAKQISITGIRDADQMKRLLSDASTLAASILRQDKQERRVANFVYSAENDIVAKMGYLQHRTKESPFLKEGEVDAIFNTIDNFSTPRPNTSSVPCRTSSTSCSTAYRAAARRRSSRLWPRTSG